MQHTKHIERSLLSSNLRILKAKYIPIETIFNPLQTNFYIHFFFLLSLGPQFMNREECAMIGFIFVLGIKKTDACLVLIGLAVHTFALFINHI